MRCVLAIDAGGSKCDALLVRDDGTVLGYGHVGATDPAKGTGKIGSGRSTQSISSAIYKAIGDNICDELILAEFNTILPAVNFYRMNVDCIRIRVVSEQDPAFVLTGEDHGVVVLAGTGAVVHGRTPDGKRRSLDGLGPALGDHGGGYQIGLSAMRAVAQSFWHPRHTTALSDTILKEFNARDGHHVLSEVINFTLNDPDRSEIARFAKIVDDIANDGDRIAREILHKAADDLAESTRDIMDYLEIATESFPLIGTGSVIMYSNIYWDRFCERVQTFAPNYRFMRLQEPPVLGMALKVLQNMECGDNEELRVKIRDSYKAFTGKQQLNTVTEKN